MSDAFDKKFRERLSEEDFPFDPDAWQKMEKKLDALNDDTNRKPFWWWLAPLVLLLLGTGAFLWWRSSTTPASNNVVETAATARGTIAPADTALHKDQIAVTPNVGTHTNNPAQSPSAEVTPAVTTPPAAATQKINAMAGGITATAKQYATDVEKNNKTAGLGAAVNNQPAPKRPVADNAVLPANNAPVQLPGNITETGVLQSSNPANENNAAKENEVLQLLHTYYFTQPAIAANIHSSVHLPLREVKEKPAKKQPVPQRRGFTVGLTLGPVFNVAPSMEYGRFGLDGGLLISYHVNNHLSFTTGAVYSDKPYGGTRSDYGVVKTWSYPMNQVKRIQANCKVLDVPININYTFMNRPGYTLTASAGLSSYLMLKENYSYKRDYMPDWQKSLSNENQHYLSVLNLAFSYQFPLNSRMSLGIQPFAKIPLRDIGFGQVKLYSTGVAVQLNFNRFMRKQ